MKKYIVNSINNPELGWEVIAESESAAWEKISSVKRLTITQLKKQFKIRIK